ncbi:MAG: HNH endonuclease [Bacteroidota bacterium]
MKRITHFIIVILLLLAASLNLKGQVNGYTIEENNTGITSLYQGSELIAKATELNNLVQSAIQMDFPVFGYDFYPILATVDPTCGYDKLFETAVLQSNNQASAYALVVKEFQPDGNVYYRTHLKLPSASPFDLLTIFEKEAINTLFLEAIETKAKEDPTNRAFRNAVSERAGIAFLLTTFQAIIDGQFSITGNVFELAGFESVDVDPTQVFERAGITGNVPTSGGQGNCTFSDYCGMKVSDGPGTPGFYRDDLGAVTWDASNPIEDLFSTFSHDFILTDNVNTSAEMESAKQKFESSGGKLIVWMHFANDPSSPTDVPKILFKYGDNLTDEDAERILNTLFIASMGEWIPDLELGQGTVAALGETEESNLRNGGCNPNFKWGKTCLLPQLEGWYSSQSDVFGAAIGVGLLDGLLGTIQTIYDLGKGVGKSILERWKRRIAYIKDVISYGLQTRSFRKVAGKVLRDATQSIKESLDRVKQVYTTLKSYIDNLDYEKFREIVQSVFCDILNWFEDLTNLDKEAGYDVGLLAFDLVLGALTGGASAGSGFLAKMLKWGDGLLDSSKGVIGNMLNEVGKKAAQGGEYAVKVFKCKILGRGCFMRGTPVVIAVNDELSFDKDMFVEDFSVTSIPIENVKLFDYVVTKQNIASSDDLIASKDNYSISKDPYITNQQEERDKFELDEENWYEVAFEEIRGNSYCKLALHKKWMDKQGIHRVGDIQQLYLPEQGILGQNRVTSIKHILPQKRIGEEGARNFILSPVTGVFVHQSNDVWSLTFENGDSIQITSNHPVYSLEVTGWKSASSLEIGERVSTLKGNTRLENKRKLQGTFEVFNLEVKQWHNFLVGKNGLVVHNSGNCFKEVIDLYTNNNKTFQLPRKERRLPPANPNLHAFEIEAVVDEQVIRIPYTVNGFPDFTNPDWFPGVEFIYKPAKLVGDNDGNKDFTPAYQWLKEKFKNDTNIKFSGKNGGAFDITINNVKRRYTWHHHEDGKSMIPVLQSIHSAANPHTGGASLIKIDNGAYIGLFDSID